MSEMSEIRNSSWLFEVEEEVNNDKVRLRRQEAKWGSPMTAGGPWHV